MNTEFRAPQGPPWDIDVVADVHAGVYPAEQTTELLERIADDEQGAAILAALDSAVDELSLLPALTMPDKYVMRMDAAIAAEYSAQADVGSGSGADVGSGSGADVGAGVLRGGMEALLHPGAAPARPGLPRPVRSTRAGAPARPGLPRQGGGRHPEHPPAHRPVIPRVLPGATRPAAFRPSLTSSTPPSQSSSSSSPQPSAPPPPRAVGHGRPGTGKPHRGARVGSLEAQRAKRRRWTGGLLAAAAVVAIGAVTTLSLTSNSGNDNMAEDGATPAVTVTAPGVLPPDDEGAPAFNIEPGKFGDSLDKIEGKQASGGPFADPAGQAACLGAIGVTDFTAVEGISEVTFEDQDAFAIAIDQGDGTVEVVVVGDQCGVDGADDVLGRQTVEH